MRRIVPPGCDLVAYDFRCPTCGAEPGYLCVNRRGEVAHPGSPHRHCDQTPHTPLPDLSGWWRSMAIYEGMRALPRPKDLKV